MEIFYEMSFSVFSFTNSFGIKKWAGVSLKFKTNLIEQHELLVYWMVWKWSVVNLLIFFITSFLYHLQSFMKKLENLRKRTTYKETLASISSIFVMNYWWVLTKRRTIMCQYNQTTSNPCFSSGTVEQMKYSKLSLVSPCLGWHILLNGSKSANKWRSSHLRGFVNRKEEGLQNKLLLVLIKILSAFICF